MTFDPSSAVPEQEFDPNTAVPEEAPPVRAVLQTAVKVNPDQAARAATLGKERGLPADLVLRNLQSVELQDAVDKADERLKTSPKLAAAMRKRPEIASLAHDDLEPLAKIESNFAKVAAASAGQAVLGISEGIWRTPDAAQRAVGYLAGQVERTGLPQYLNPIRGVQDVLQFISEGRAPVGPKLFAGTNDAADRVNDAQKILTDKATFGSAFADAQTLAQNADKALATAVQTGNLDHAAQVLTDPNYWAAFLSQAAPSLYAAMKSGGSVAFMGWMEGMEQAGNAAEFEKKTGQKISDAEFTQAVTQTALVNALLEKYGLDKVLGAKGKGLAGIAKAIFAEGGTEGLQQLNSNVSALLAYNPEQSLSEGIMASVMGGAGAGGAMSSAQAAAEQVQAGIDKRRQQADAANQYSDELADQLKTAGAAALRERSPEQFRELMSEMTDGKVYVDGEVLNQLPEDVKAALPQSVRDQIATAAATGDVVEIATADVLTVAPGTPLEQVLVEHARTDPFAMSKADAAEATKLAQSSVMGEAQRIIQQGQDADARRAEYDAIHKLYADQLNAAARFRPAVNEAKAHWLASFYTTMAARTGMTPAEFQAAHPVQVLGAPSATASGPVMDNTQLEQITPEQARETNVPVEMPTAPEFAEAVTNTQGAQITDEGLVMDLVRFQKPEQEGAQAIRTGVFYLPAKSADARHYRNAKTGYGGSERFNAPTLIRRPLFVKGATGGAAPEQAYKTLKGKDAFKQLEHDVMQPVLKGGYWGVTRDDKVKLIEDFLDKYAPDRSGYGREIESVSREGNTLRYALQELAVAYAVREAGYDAVVGYSAKKTGPAISEVFDVREQTFPAQGMDSQVHDDFYKQNATGPGTPAFDAWFGDSKVRDAEGKPLVVYHGTRADFDKFDSTTFGSSYPSELGDGFYFTSYRDVASAYATGEGGRVMPTYLRLRNPFAAKTAEEARNVPRNGEWDGITFAADSRDGQPYEFVVFNPTQIKSATGNNGNFDPQNPSILEQTAPTPRGTFNPRTLELVLNPNANLSTWFHETGHFFLEVLADVASQPNAPAQITEDMNTFLKWAGIPDLQTWNSLDLDGKRAAHERWAESIEQYVMEGKAPSVELQPLMRRFTTWLKSVYGSIKRMLASKPDAEQTPLNDDIRRVMDRMLATDEQIAQANEVAGLVPDEAADASAAERLAKRSIADLKWSVKARDHVIAKLQKQAKAIEKDIREQVTIEVDQSPEMRAKKALDALSVSPEYAAQLAEHKAARKAAETAARDEVKAALLAENPDAKGLVKGQLLAKNKRDIDNKVDAAMIRWDRWNPAPKRPVSATDEDVATIADSFGFESVDAMMQAIDAFGSRREAIDGLTEKRMLEEHGDLIDERAISEAANAAVHNEARARSLASELRTQREMLNPRQDTGQTNAKGSKITVNALVEAAKQFAANVVSRTALRDLPARAWQHTAAERRAAKRWTEATAAGKTDEAVKAKQDQMLNHAAAKAAIEAKDEAQKILDFFRRVTKGNDETVVEKGRDADIVNAARAVLAAYGVQGPASKNAADYLETLKTNDPETYNVLAPMVEGATRNAQPLDAITFEELQALNEEVQAMWFLAKRSRQMEVDGDLLDVQEVADEVYARLEEIGIPDTLPGETGALTNAEIQARRWLQQVPALLRRVEQWAEAKDGKFGGPFSRFIFGPVKAAADRYRADRLEYRRKFQALVDKVAPFMPAKTIAAPELGYVFGRGHNGIGMAELLHAIAHTGNESNKRKLLLGRDWAADNGDGTIDTSKWDAFIARLAADGALRREHYDFVQGVWDLMEQTKPLAQQTHRAVFGRYFAEVTADEFVDPFGVQRAGGYIPAQADPLLVQDADLRELLETDNAGMSQAFPATSKGFTKARVEYNRPLKLDLRTLPQHIDKVLLFSHMEPAVRGVAKLLRQPKVSQPLSRVDPATIGGMLKPWLNRSARQTVETPVSADAGLNRVLSTIRGRVGMALMFANISNTLQQITGFSSAALKVKPGLMRRAAAQFIASPQKFKDAVHALSPYMADRASNEVSVLSDTMEKILINPGVFARAESWTKQHAYFLQTAFDNVMSPIIWTGAYNQGVAEGMDERMAVRYADGVIRQTQGSTLPEDVSRIETGPAYARVFTQFIGYFNMLANTNATALQQIAQEQGLKKGAGKAFGVLMLGLLVPIWVAEAIAHAMRGGPDDKDDDGYLDDWLAAVFGFGTIKGILGGLPFIGAAAQSAVNRFNDQPADDKFSLSPTVSVLESAVGAPASVYGAIADDKNAQKAVRDVSALITVTTGLPAMAAARPLGYAAGLAQGRIEPTGPVDAARGLATGTASPDSKQR